MNWKLAGSLECLRKQIDARYPSRSRKSDGTIGDARHQKEKSDHNPNERGVVLAMDVTHDPVNGPNCTLLAEKLRISEDPRIAYVIWNRRIFSSTKKPWTWRPYYGENPHDKHMHISVRDDIADDVPWKIN